MVLDLKYNCYFLLFLYLDYWIVFLGLIQREGRFLPSIVRLGMSNFIITIYIYYIILFLFDILFLWSVFNIFSQKLQDKDVVLTCLYAFEGEEDDELSIAEGQVSRPSTWSSSIWPSCGFLRGGGFLWQPSYDSCQLGANPNAPSQNSLLP